MEEHNEVVRRALEAMAAIAGPISPKVAKPRIAADADRTNGNAVVNPTTGMAAQDCAAWLDEFTKWIREQCIRRDGYEDRGGCGALYVNFCEWTVLHRSVPCNRQTFEQLLRDAGYRLVDGLVFNLILRADLWALEDPTAFPFGFNQLTKRTGGRTL